MSGVLFDSDVVEPIQQPTKFGYSISDLYNGYGRKAMVMESNVIAVAWPAHISALF